MPDLYDIAGKRLNAGEIAKGAIGLAKAMVGVDRASDQTIHFRQAICRVCEYQDLGECSGGPGCKCWIKPKTQIASQKCPDSPPRWDAEREDGK